MNTREDVLETGITSSQVHLQVVLEFWKDFNLDGRRLQLDKQGLELQDAKDASIVRRKSLAELTKEFRKKPDHDKVSGVQRLVRAYQEEIDALAKRCRASDAAFFSLYKSLYEAPDPAQALERLASERPRAAASELEVQKLKEELSEYEEEFSKLKNQDITIRRLEEVIAGFEEGAEAKVVEEAEARAKEVQEAADAQVQAARDREAQVDQRLQTSEEMLAEARATAETLEARLSETWRKAQEAEAAWEVEREILSQSNESSQAQLARLDQELQDLRKGGLSGSRASALPGQSGVSAASTSPAGATIPASSSSGGRGGGGGSGGLSHSDAVEAELAELTRVNTQLRGEMAAKSAAWREAEEALKAAVRSAKEQATGELEAAAALRKELEARPTGEEVRSLRHQLRVLQQLVFNAGDDEGDPEAGLVGGEEAHGVDPEDTAGHVERTMEQVIRGRVRRLEADLTSSRRAAEERAAEVAKLQRALDDATALAAQRLESVNRLEDDLAATSAFRSAGGSSGGSGIAGGAGRGVSATGGGASLAGEGGVGGAQALRELLGVTEGSAAGGGGEAAAMDRDHGVLDIVQAQRDRFRRRIKELEFQRDEDQREARNAQSVMERLQRDNLQLYEKVRFLQSYQRGPPTRPSGGDVSGRLPAALEEGMGGDMDGRQRGSLTSTPTEARYGQMYEARINPFTQFSQRERQRKYQELTVAEKITLSTTRMFLGNKFARNFVFFYVVVLHLVVFFTLNYWTHSHSANCVPSSEATAAAVLHPL